MPDEGTSGLSCMKMYSRTAGLSRLKMLFPNSRQESGLLRRLKDFFPVFLPDILRFVRMNIFLTSLYDQLPVLSAYN